MLKGDTCAETIIAAEIPVVVIIRFLVDNDWTDQRDEGGGVVVKGTVEVFLGRTFGFEGGLGKKVERHLRL